MPDFFKVKIKHARGMIVPQAELTALGVLRDDAGLSQQ
jgi:hypothetical protein